MTNTHCLISNLRLLIIKGFSIYFWTITPESFVALRLTSIGSNELTHVTPLPLLKFEGFNIHIFLKPLRLYCGKYSFNALNKLFTLGKWSSNDAPSLINVNRFVTLSLFLIGGLILFFWPKILFAKK